MRRSADWGGRRWLLLALAAAALIAAGCGGATTDRAARTPLAVDDIGVAQGCTGYGHSYVAGAGLRPDQTFLNLVCRRYRLPVTNDGVSGSSLQSQLLATLGQIPHDASRQLSIVMWGINDLGVFGPSLGGFRGALRLLVSRLRSGFLAIHGYRDSALRYSGAWSDSVGEKVTRRAGAFTWASPRSFPGGSVAFLMTIRRGVGARYAFTLDGRPVGSFDTRRLSPPPPAPVISTPVAYRIAVGAGSHLIRCVITAIKGGANLVGWQLESRRPPLVVLVEQPRLPSYQAYRIIHSPFVPTDATVTALNASIAGVAKEFGSYVVTVDADRVLGKRRALFQPDELHPDALGDKLLAAAIERAIERSGHVSVKVN